MKKLLLLACLPLSLSAQTDTLDAFFKPTNATTLAAPNGGYVSGNNGYGDKEKVQSFIPAQPYSIVGVLVWIGHKDVVSPNPDESSTWLKIRRLDLTTQTTVPFIAGPKETLDSVEVPLNSLVAGTTPETGLNYIPLNAPFLVTQAYTVGLTFGPELQSDTLAIMHSANDSVVAAGQSWEIWNGNWRRMIDNWGLNIDFALFPVIDTTLNSTDNLEKIDLNLWPNPASDILHLSTPITTTADDILIQVYAADGRKIMHFSEPSGQSNLSVPLQLLAPGMYLISYRQGKHYACKPFLIGR